MTAARVHILEAGLPLCRFSDAQPVDWPIGEMWIMRDWFLTDRPVAAVMCETCAGVARGEVYLPPKHGWTCFHCGETFHVEAQARGHFGTDPMAEPACLVRAAALARVPRVPRREWPDMYRLRDLEAEVAKLRAEAEDEHSRAYYARQESEIRGTAAAFKDCRTLRDVFNLYDSMEGRALAAEERATAAEQQRDTLAAENSARSWVHGTD